MKILRFPSASEMKRFFTEKDKEKRQKISRKQNYLCKTYGCQFIGDHALRYKGCHSALTEKIRLILIRGTGIRDIAAIEKISIKKVLSTLVCSRP
jgi:transposase-like protein